ncbi:MAG: HPr family phosphocarrier protein [Candidatus Firestonebacteria bacterium]
MTTKANYLEKEVEIANKLGLHLRAAALFVKLANQYKSEVFVKKGVQQVDGKSIMGIMTLAAPFGSKIKIMSKGSDANEMLNALEKLIKIKFGEKE